jgi:hypothetical protein
MAEEHSAGGTQQQPDFTGSIKPSSDPSNSGQAHATIMIEEPTSEYFSWSVYFTSYFKKWRGGSLVG